jgi:hypothetical protein
MQSIEQHRLRELIGLRTEYHANLRPEVFGDAARWRRGIF